MRERLYRAWENKTTSKGSLETRLSGWDFLIEFSLDGKKEKKMIKKWSRFFVNFEKNICKVARDDAVKQ